MVRPKIKNGRQIHLYISEEVLNLINQYRRDLSISTFIEEAVLAVIKGPNHVFELSQNLLSVQDELKRSQEENERLRRENKRLKKKLASLQAETEESIEKVLFTAKERKELQRQKVLKKITRQLRAALENTEEWRAPLEVLCREAGLDYDMVSKIFWKELVNTYVESNGMRMWYDKSIEVKKQGEEPCLYLDGWWEKAHRKEIEIVGEMLEEGRAWEDIVREYYLKTQGREPNKGEIGKMVFEFWKNIGKKRYIAKFHEGWYMEKVDGSYILHRELQYQPKEVEVYA